MRYLTKFLLLGLTLWYSTVSAQIGVYTVNGDLTMSGAVSTEIQLVNNTGGPGIGHDQVNVVGNLTLAGPLTIVLDGYTPNLMHLFEIASYSGTLTGTFSSIVWPIGMTTGWSIDYGVLSPGKVTIYGSQSPLPVQLMKFEGKATKEGNLLLWYTASEVNSDFFAIEYSGDGNTFKEVGQLTAKGTSRDIQHYSYLHKGFHDAVSYYRLKQVDYDSKSENSAIIRIQNKIEKDQVSIYPNPTQGILYFSTAIDHVQIYDNTGKIALEASSAGNSIDISHLPAGNYYISLNHSTKTEKVFLKR